MKKPARIIYIITVVLIFAVLYYRDKNPRALISVLPFLLCSILPLERIKQQMKKHIKSLVSYLIAVFFAFLFMLYLDEESGMIIFAAVLLIPLLSICLTLVMLRGLKISVDVSDAIVHKGDSILLSVLLEKRFPLPTSFIDFTLMLMPAFEVPENDEIRTAMSFSKKRKVEQKLTSRFCGKCRVGITSVRIIDYIGLFSFDIPCGRIVSRDVEILPEIVKIPPDNDIFNEIASQSVISDDDETTAASSHVSTSFAGYEHREYIGGDPIKRINWKLSSKRGILMVRLDEVPASVKPLFVLDVGNKKNAVLAETVLPVKAENKVRFLDSFSKKAPVDPNAPRKCSPEEAAQNAVFEDYTLMCEGMLGVLLMLVRQSISCRFSCELIDDGAIITIDSPESLNALSVKLASVNPILDSGKLFNMQKQLSGSLAGEESIMLFSMALDGDVKKYIKKLYDAGTVIAVLPQSVKSAASVPCAAYYFDSALLLQKCV